MTDSTRVPRRPRLLAAAAAIVVLVLFAAGLWRLVGMRFRAGEMYPAYSTFNAGPMGARALFDSFEKLGSPSVERNTLPLGRMKGRPGTTLMFAGVGQEFFSEDTIKNFESFERLMRGGVHVVAALDSRSIPYWSWRKEPMADPWKPSDGPFSSPPLGGRRGRSDSAEEEEMVSAGERWGFRFVPDVDPDRAPEDGWKARPLGAGGAWEIPRWFSVWRWADLGPAWEPLAAIDGEPVIVRRAFGDGSLTLLSDSIFLSNEALWRAPKPGFLLWLLAREPRLVFDETLHGTMSAPGVMSLVRRYRLLGFFAGAAVVLALFAWRAGASLVPPHPSVAESVEQPLIGAGGSSGFSNLLRQTIPPRRLLRACFTEWAKSPFVRRRVGEATVAAARDLVAQGEQERRQNPAAVYRAVAALLASARRGESSR